MSVVCDVVCGAVGDQYLGSPLSGGSVQGSYGISFTWMMGVTLGIVGWASLILTFFFVEIIFSSKFSYQ